MGLLLVKVCRAHEV